MHSLWPASLLSPPSGDPATARQRMVVDLQRQGIRDARVLAAMGRLPRHEFVPEPWRGTADPYGDNTCEVGFGATLSQPLIVAHMTAALALLPTDRVLEIGTGCGYQAAVLAALCAEVYTMEIVAPLTLWARTVFQRIGITNIHTRIADGHSGWPEAAPFDAIILTCAPATLPPALTGQLADGGRLIAPIGVAYQRLVRITRRGASLDLHDDLPVRFVPMQGSPE